ncbi:hypothetical protein ACT4S5_09560 [Kocuria oceani]
MDDTTAGFTQAWLLLDAMDRVRFIRQSLWLEYRGQGGTVAQFEF